MILDIKELMKAKRRLDMIKRKQKDAMGDKKNPWGHKRELNVQNARIDFEHAKEEVIQNVNS